MLFISQLCIMMMIITTNISLCQELKRGIPINPLSKCSYAYGIYYEYDSSHALQSLFNYQPFTPPGEVKLKMIDVGFTAAGTAATFSQNKLKARAACHENECIPSGLTSPFFDHYQRLVDCLGNGASDGDCAASNWLDRLQQLLKTVVSSGIESLSGGLLPYVHRELLDLAPNLLVLHSVLDPYDWVLQQLQHDAGVTIICKSPQQQKQLNPFDILHCIGNTGQLNDYVTTLAEYVLPGDPKTLQLYLDKRIKVPKEFNKIILEVGRHYRNFNQQILNAVVKEKNLQPSCVADYQ